MCLVKVLLPNEVLQCVILLLRREASMGIAEVVVRAGGPREVVRVPRSDAAHKLVAAAMGKWAVIHVVELISTMATGANWVTRVSCGDECGPRRSSQVTAVQVCPAIVLGTPLLRTSLGTSLWTGIVTIHIGTHLKWCIPFWDPSVWLLYTSDSTDVVNGGLLSSPSSM